MPPVARASGANASPARSRASAGTSSSIGKNAPRTCNSARCPAARAKTGTSASRSVAIAPGSAHCGDTSSRLSSEIAKLPAIVAHASGSILVRIFDARDTTAADASPEREFVSAQIDIEWLVGAWLVASGLVALRVRRAWAVTSASAPAFESTRHPSVVLAWIDRRRRSARCLMGLVGGVFGGLAGAAFAGQFAFGCLAVAIVAGVATAVGARERPPRRLGALFALVARVRARDTALIADEATRLGAAYRAVVAYEAQAPHHAALDRARRRLARDLMAGEVPTRVAGLLPRFDPRALAGWLVGSTVVSVAICVGLGPTPHRSELPAPVSAAGEDAASGPAPAGVSVDETRNPGAAQTRPVRREVPDERARERALPADAPHAPVESAPPGAVALRLTPPRWADAREAPVQDTPPDLAADLAIAFGPP